MCGQIDVYICPMLWRTECLCNYIHVHKVCHGPNFLGIFYVNTLSRILQDGQINSNENSSGGWLAVLDFLEMLIFFQWVFLSVLIEFISIFLKKIFWPMVDFLIYLKIYTIFGNILRWPFSFQRLLIISIYQEFTITLQCQFTKNSLLIFCYLTKIEEQGHSSQEE